MSFKKLTLPNALRSHGSIFIYFRVKRNMEYPTFQLFYLLSLFPLIYSQDNNQCSSNPPTGPVTINTFGACASAEMETRLKVVEDMVTSLRNQGNDAKGKVNRMKGQYGVQKSLHMDHFMPLSYHVWTPSWFIYTSYHKPLL